MKISDELRQIANTPDGPNSNTVLVDRGRLSRIAYHAGILEEAIATMKQERINSVYQERRERRGIRLHSAIDHGDEVSGD